LQEYDSCQDVADWREAPIAVVQLFGNYWSSSGIGRCALETTLLTDMVQARHYPRLTQSTP
jgi:hypothetical protein